jgi:hypothetical protein
MNLNWIENGWQRFLDRLKELWGQAGGSRPRGGLIVWGGLNSLRHTRFPQLSKSVNTTPLTTGVVDVGVWRDEQRNAR